MIEWLSSACETLAAGEPLVLVTVCGVEGSAPREAGAKMLVTADRCSGTIGGGALEFAATGRARQMLADDARAAHFEDFPLGPALGQCCGGRVRIGYERLGPEDLPWLEEAQGACARGGTVILERSVSGPAERRVRRRDGPKDAERDVAPTFLFLNAAGAALADAMPPLEECHRIRERLADARARVFVFGAGHVGTAMAEILTSMPAVVTWIDRRGDRLPGSHGANIETMRSGDEVKIAAEAPAGACYFVLTHDHQLDYDLVHEILKRGDAAYCGLIGSQTKRSRFERRLRRAGLDDEAIAKLRCPMGGGALESKAPAIIALCAIHEMFLAHEAQARGA